MPKVSMGMDDDDDEEEYEEEPADEYEDVVSRVSPLLSLQMALILLSGNRPRGYGCAGQTIAKRRKGKSDASRHYPRKN